MKRLFFTVVFLGIIVTLSLTLLNWESHAEPWSYDGERGPDNWGELSSDYRVCSEGPEQSPVNIESLVANKFPPLKVNYENSSLTLHNNGHTLNIAPENHQDIDLDGVSFELIQFHYHTPSEHRLSGETFPIEFHFVHQNNRGDLAVLGIMGDEGEAHPGFEKIIGEFPIEPGEETNLEDPLDLNGLLPSSLQTVRYAGSLTTPPCSEGLQWMVATKVIQMSPWQIEQFKQLLGNNSRPVQDLHDRKIFFDFLR